MRAIEADNEDLKDVLPRTYNRLDKDLVVSLLKNFASVPMHSEGDAFGKIYEYFLGKFAMTEGQKGGEFFTPTSIVKLIVEIIEPYQGRIFDQLNLVGLIVASLAELGIRRPGRNQPHWVCDRWNSRGRVVPAPSTPRRPGWWEIPLGCGPRRLFPRLTANHLGGHGTRVGFRVRRMSDRRCPAGTTACRRCVRNL